MIKKSLIFTAAYFFMTAIFLSLAVAESDYKFSSYDKQVATESIIWSVETDSKNLQGGQFSLLKKKVLESNFHASLGRSTYGSLLDFIISLSKIYPVQGIEMKVSNYKKAIEKPYSVARPLITAYCTLQIVYKPYADGTLAYNFKFLYHSDTEKLKKLSKDNGFPNTESMDKNTVLIMIKEYVTDQYPEGFKKMDAPAFDLLITTPVNTLKDYIELKK